jgi:hypothetical protein
MHTYINTHTYIHTYISRGAAPLCVAGVALGDVHLDYMQGRFAWQAPHWWHLVTYTLISRGTRCGTISRPWRQQLIMTIYQVWLPATGHAERVRKICGFARKSAEHYFGQRKYGEHTIALIEGSAIKDLSGSNVGKKTSEPGGARRRRVRHVVRPSVQHTPLDPTKNFRGKHILFLFWPSVTSHYLVEETPPPCKTNGQVTI